MGVAGHARRPSWSPWPPSTPSELDGDDIDDPLGQPAEAYAACAERLDGLVTPVIAALVKTMAGRLRGPRVIGC